MDDWYCNAHIATCRHIARYQVDLKYVKGNMLKCQRLPEQNNKGYIFDLYMYMKIIGKLLGHVTMWPCIAGHISNEIYKVLVIAAVYWVFTWDTHIEFSFGRLLWISLLCGANCNWQYSLWMLIWILISKSLFEYFYGIPFLNQSVSVPIPHMVYSYRIFYYKSRHANMST